METTKCEQWRPKGSNTVIRMNIAGDAFVRSYHTPDAPLIRETSESRYSESPEIGGRQIRLATRRSATGGAPRWRRSEDSREEPNPAPGRSNRWRTRLVRLAIAGCVAVVVAALAARERLAAMVPQLAPVYAGIGLPVNPLGLAIEDVSARLGEAKDKKFLVIEGRIVNLRATPMKSPDLKISVRDSAGGELYVWTTRAPARLLERAQRVKFAARLEAPPDGANDAIVQFVEPGKK
jgi:hypothetical protein